MRKIRRPMAKLMLVAALATGASLLSFAPAAQASSFLVQLDDLTDTIVGNTFQDGVNVQSINFGGETINNATYTLFNSATLVSGVDVALNIFDPDGVTLSDTLSITGTAGSRTLNVAFFSDVDGGPALTPLIAASSIIETGNFQTVLLFTASTEDAYTWQFRSDVNETPLPGAIWLFGTALAGALGVGKWRRRQKKAAAIAAA